MRRLALPQSSGRRPLHSARPRRQDEGRHRIQRRLGELGRRLASTYRVVDADVYVETSPGMLESSLGLKDNEIRHESKDTFSFRLGGSYHIPSGANTVILRGGIAHDTRYAKDGWLRADVDGAARTMFAVGGAFRTKKFQIDGGFGFVYEGTQDNPGTCNILVDTPTEIGCNNDGNERPVQDRRGLDPINPLVVANQQREPGHARHVQEPLRDVHARHVDVVLIATGF
jgi:hypothetical protein